MTTVRQKMLRTEDFPPEQRSWIEPLLRYCNDLNTDTSSILNGGLRLLQNAAAFATTVTLQLQASGTPNSAFPITIKNKLPGGTKPIGVQLMQAVDVTVASAPSPISVGGSPAWALKGNDISIVDVAGLVALRKYKLTFLVLG